MSGVSLWMTRRMESVRRKFMRKLVAGLTVTVMLVSLTACGNRNAQDVEPIKESVVMESNGVSSVTEENDAESEEAGSANMEAEENAENTTEEAAADSENGETVAADDEATPEETGSKTDTDQEGNSMKITAGDTVFTATLADNSSAEALKEILAEGPLTIDMSDYAGMEKVGPIGTDLSRNDEQISTKAGDIILYQGNSLVIYYDTNSWNFTRIGKIEGVTGEELLDAFGDGDVTVTFSLE